MDTTGPASTVTDYGLGARGVDYIASTKSGTTTVGFPIYDCHGSMTACLFRSGTTYYSLGNQRHYDAWGIVRSGVATGDPKGRYCASLGHKQDDESGLVYMRARYFEPTSGRFLREDPYLQGPNFLVYAGDNPNELVDRGGKAHYHINEEEQQTYTTLEGTFAVLIGATVMCACARDHVGAIGFANVAVFVGCAMLGCSNLPMLIQVLLQTPGLAILVLSVVLGAEALASNPVTLTLAGLATAQLVIDIAALAWISAGQ